MTRPACRLLALLAAAALVVPAAGCGSGEGAAAPSPAPAHAPAADSTTVAAATPAAGGADWTRFGVDAARTNVARTGLSARAVTRLRERRVSLDGTVDSSPIFLHAVRVGGRMRDVVVVTTTYGRTEALDPAKGAVLWRFTPAAYDRVRGSAQITTATPVADPRRRFVFAASPDGRVHKLALADGREARSGAWPAVVSREPVREKLASALNLDGRWVYAALGGYLGDQPPYQGKVVAIDRGTGAVGHVFNVLCSDRRAVIDPSSCRSQEAAIWGRAGVVVQPGTHDLFVATSNGPFDGRTDWGDSVLRLSRGAGRLERHYTPANQRVLETTDADLGSAAPALLSRTLLLQGGKDGRLRLLDVRRSLHGVTGADGPRLGGEVQTLPLRGSGTLVSAIAVRRTRGSTLAFVGTEGATTAYRLRGARLRVAWSKRVGATSPVLAGGLLWAYDPAGALRVLRPATGRVLRTLPAPAGHWNSPIVAGGRVYLPSGDANDHRTAGTLSVYAPR